MKVTNTLNEKQTAAAASEFASKLKAGDIVRLHGEIGVGKTVFVRGVASYFGCAEDVCSPTFAIMNIYGDNPPIYHFDLYRFENEDEIYDAGLDEFLGGGGISLVEWPELLKNFYSERIFDITIEKDSEKGENFRLITEKLTERNVPNNDNFSD